MHPDDPDYVPTFCPSCGQTLHGPDGDGETNYPRNCRRCDADICEMCQWCGLCLECADKELIPGGGDHV